MSSNTAYRVAKGVHLNQRKRKKLRSKLLKRDGNVCCWCNKPMVVPFYKTPMLGSLEDMATLEHYFAVESNDPDNENLIKLAHKRCNK